MSVRDIYTSIACAVCAQPVRDSDPDTKHTTDGLPVHFDCVDRCAECGSYRNNPGPGCPVFDGSAADIFTDPLTGYVDHTFLEIA